MLCVSAAASALKKEEEVCDDDDDDADYFDIPPGLDDVHRALFDRLLHIQRAHAANKARIDAIDRRIADIDRRFAACGATAIVSKLQAQLDAANARLAEAEFALAALGWSTPCE